MVETQAMADLVGVRDSFEATLLNFPAKNLLSVSSARLKKISVIQLAVIVPLMQWAKVLCHS